MHIDGRIDINTTPERLWPWLTEFEQMKRWMPDLISEEPITPGPMQVGSTARMKVKEGSREVDYTSEITELEEGNILQIKLSGGSLGAGPMQVAYELHPADGHTTVRLTSDWKPHGIMLRIMSPLINIMAGRNTRTALARLKDVVESEDAV